MKNRVTMICTGLIVLCLSVIWSEYRNSDIRSYIASKNDVDSVSFYKYVGKSRDNQFFDTIVVSNKGIWMKEYAVADSAWYYKDTDPDDPYHRHPVDTASVNTYMTHTSTLVSLKRHMDDNNTRYGDIDFLLRTGNDLPYNYLAQPGDTRTISEHSQILMHVGRKNHHNIPLSTPWYDGVPSIVLSHNYKYGVVDNPNFTGSTVITSDEIYVDKLHVGTIVGRDDGNRAHVFGTIVPKDVDYGSALAGKIAEDIGDAMLDWIISKTVTMVLEAIILSNDMPVTTPTNDSILVDSIRQKIVAK